MNRHKWTFNLMLILTLVLGVTVPVSAQTLVIDGQFGDWVDQPNVTDPAGDGPTANTDVLAFYWGNNPNDEHIYWMIERVPVSSGNPRAYYFVFIDTNGNDSYTDSVDRLVQVMYDPGKDSGYVQVTVFTGNNVQINQYGGNWGETVVQGGRKAEWRVSFANLGIDAHQTIHMYAAASQNAQPNNIDRLPDQGNITWAPIPTLGWPWLILAFVVVVGVVWWTRGRRHWKS